MLALVTGANSGIGLEIARYLAELRYDLILTARNTKALASVQEELVSKGVAVEILSHDLSKREECFNLYEETREREIDFLVNCAGLGVYGRFLKTDLEQELSLIDVNVTALHILTKLFLQDMAKRGSGIILNVGSSAGFLAGPTFSSYYASKNYVVRLTEAIHEELRRDKSPVKISCLCPGPVATDFDRRAGVKSSLRGRSAAYVARCGVDGARKGKMLIVPGLGMKLGVVLGRLPGDHLMTRITYRIQNSKGGRNAKKR